MESQGKTFIKSMTPLELENEDSPASMTPRSFPVPLWEQQKDIQMQ